MKLEHKRFYRTCGGKIAQAFLRDLKTKTEWKWILDFGNYHIWCNENGEPNVHKDIYTAIELVLPRTIRFYRDSETKTNIYMGWRYLNEKSYQEAKRWLRDGNGLHHVRVGNKIFNRVNVTWLRNLL